MEREVGKVGHFELIKLVSMSEKLGTIEGQLFILIHCQIRFLNGENIN